MDVVIRRQIRLTEEQLRMLKQLSASTGRPVAELIREAVDRLGEIVPGHRRGRAVASIGGFHSGSSHISDSHDGELSTAFGE